MGLLDSVLSALGLRKGASASDDPSAPVDPERDPALEQRDGAGSFDFEADIARYFTAEFRIDTLWANLERRDELFVEYAIRDVAHWYQIKATFERWLETPAGKARFATPAALMQARMTTTQTIRLDDLERPP
ncbi:hypothetical protein [Enhygromyxa salina]|uniref:Uncharacterized protein n=1 Tax=Enhygromyxa salina TaxID=215803 RepID=A0A2S9YSA2_9BACT|nr:hypothetical protein [Enhygromyxa salina]PRQ07973.1 hypothetical protein ENSA7_22570 [Enhygromyxa salina]